MCHGHVGYILESILKNINHRVTLLAGGVGGARMALALRNVLDPGSLTVIVNVGDDTERYGVHVAADPDTVMYTLAGVVGERGWGRANDTFTVMETLRDLGFDTTFSLGDRDLATCLARREMLDDGIPLSSITAKLSSTLGLDDVMILPSSDDVVRTFVQIEGDDWLEFQEYFVDRSHKDLVKGIAYHGTDKAEPATGVIEAIETADILVIAPSNPPLSIWPILAVGDIERTVKEHRCRVAVSPLFSGTALKGPVVEVMEGLGLPRGTEGVLEAYRGLIDHLFIDQADAEDATLGEIFDVEIHPHDTYLSGPDKGSEFASFLLATVTS